MTNKNQKMLTFSDISMKILNYLKDLGISKSYSEIVEKSLLFYYLHNKDQFERMMKELKALNSIEEIEKKMKDLIKNE